MTILEEHKSEKPESFKLTSPFHMFSDSLDIYRAVLHIVVFVPGLGGPNLAPRLARTK